MKFPVTLVLLVAVLCCLVEAAKRGGYNRGILDKKGMMQKRGILGKKEFGKRYILDKSEYVKRGGLTDILDKRDIYRRQENNYDFDELTDMKRGILSRQDNDDLEELSAIKREILKRQDDETLEWQTIG